MDIASQYVTVGSDRIHYLEAGEGPALLLVHGWPTSAQLWRNIIPSLAPMRRVIAIDLPGFGRSTKALQSAYTFRYFASVMDGFLAALGIDKVGLAVHDLGGPVALYWAVKNPERVTELAVLNTLAYPGKPTWAVAAFVAAASMPVVRDLLTSDWGIRSSIKVGMQDKEAAKEAGGIYAREYRTREDRRALAKSGCHLSPRGMQTIGKGLASLRVPTTLLYGAHDRILPDVERTMTRLSAEWPHATLKRLDQAGHFLQEDAPAQVGDHLASFLKANDASAAA